MFISFKEKILFSIWEFFFLQKVAVSLFFKNEPIFSQTFEFLGQLNHAEHVSDIGWVVKHHRRDVWSIKVQTFGSK